MTKISFFVAFLIVLYSCTKNYDDLPAVNSSLAKAVKNREELTKVLNHYSRKSKDSLKFKAACYLVSNMKGHHSLLELDEVPGEVETSFISLDSLVRATYFINNKITSFRFVDEFNKIYNDYDYSPASEKIDSFIQSSNYALIENITPQFNRDISPIRQQLVSCSKKSEIKDTICYDLENVKAKFLTDHIDNAFNMWKKSPFAKSMEFEEFSQSLLLYRYDKEPIGQFYSSFNKYFSDIINSKEVLDLNEVIRRFNFYIHSTNLFKKGEINLGNIGMYDLLQWESLKCQRRTYWSAKVLNSCGIPTVIDFTPTFINKVRGVHYWNVVRDTTGNYYPFNPLWQMLNDTSYFNLTSKVYRLTYKANRNSPALLKNKSEQLPKRFSSCFIKDVSDQYHKVTDLTVPIHVSLGERNLCYLSVFNPKRWEVVGWGKINKSGNTVTFSKVPVGVMYFPLIKNNSYAPFDYPFFVTDQGIIKKVICDPTNKINMFITRKYPKRNKLVQRMQEMKGTVIQASNRKDFTDAVDLYTLKEKDLNDMAVRAIDIFETQKFRYIRLIPPTGKMVNIALLEVFSEIKGDKRIIKGSAPNILHPKEKLLNRNKNLSLIKYKALEDSPTLSNVMDGNLKTYFVGYGITLDLGQPIKINQLRIAPRNANNGIEAGSNYELMYYNNKWISAGKQKAKFNYLQFNNIPSNTIYWLRNLDSGKEELSFIYKNGKQIFINHDDISKYFE